MSQKFCDHSYTRCCRNSATTHSVGVAKILQPLIHKGYRRNSASTHTLNITETMWPTYTAGCCRNSASSHSLDVAEIHSCIKDLYVINRANISFKSCIVLRKTTGKLMLNLLMRTLNRSLFRGKLN